MNILKTNVLDVSGKQRNYPKKKDLKTRKHKGNDNVVKFEHSSELLGNSRVVLSGENSEPKYSNYLCFVVSVQTNKLMSEYGGKYGGIAYTESQQQTHDLIKSLHESGLGYRRIAQLLNSKNITTLTGKEWKGNHVFAVLKRYRQREERLSRREEVFEPEISKFEVRWERNY